MKCSGSLKETMSGTTICLLSDFSITYLQSVLKHFEDEFKAHVHGRSCGLHAPGGAFGVSQELVTITVDGTASPGAQGDAAGRGGEVRRGWRFPSSVTIPSWTRPACAGCAWWKWRGSASRCTACTTPVADGMVVRHRDATWCRRLQRGVIEFLLLNHPLDCPVCDKGGECPLQDQTFRYGPAQGRSLDPKVRKPKAVDLGNFIVLDQERCILCRRCTRFDHEITQEDHLVITQRAHENRGDHGRRRALQLVFLRQHHRAVPGGRPDVRHVSLQGTALGPCAGAVRSARAARSGCNVHLDFRFGELLRVISRDNPELDGGWLCDRGRFNYRYVHGEERLRRPLVKKDGAFVEVSWEEAFAEIARRLRQVRRDRGGAAIGAIGGGRLTNEEAYLFQKLVRAVFGSPNVDWRVGEQYIASSREFPGRISDISQASGILLVDLLPAERIPVVDLRIRRAAGRGRALLAAVGPAMPTYRPEFKAFPARGRGDSPGSGFGGAV